METKSKMCELVTLPTTNSTNLWITKTKQNISRANEKAKPINPNLGSNICYYILSNDKIKENDYVYNIYGFVSKVFGFNMDAVKLEAGQYWKKDCRKIIATNDPTLNNYPEVSEGFLRKFILSNGTIKYVLVEYKIKYLPTVVNDNNGEYQLREYVPKISKHNTIAIKKLRDSFPKNEVKEKLISLFKNSEFVTFTNEFGLKGWDELENWFNQNFI